MTTDCGTWLNCYDGGWQGLLRPEAFSHPAKFSYALICRIVQHIYEMGWVQRGDTICDPFGGVATGGIVCGYQGLKWVGCELEPRFHTLGNQNIELHRARMEACGDPVPVLLQGDSRRLSEVIGAAECVVSSPPFQESGTDDTRAYGGIAERRQQGGVIGKTYGTTTGQLGSMPAGDVAAVLASPPYAESLDHPPGNKSFDGKGTQRHCGQIHVETGYGNSAGQLGRMKAGEVGAVVSSPPFEESLSSGKLSEEMKAEMRSRGHKPSASGESASYGTTNGNIGAESGDTFWHAAREIVAQCYAILRPGGHAVWVTKDFIRAKKRVGFTDDWIRLCESCGFRLVCRHRAMLVKEREVATLFGGTETLKTERKSFFRRLCEKRGSPPIDFEDVTCFIKA